MPLTIKHKADGTFYEQGDTQGILIPKSLPTSRFNKLATTYTSTSWWAIDLSQIAGTEQPFCTLVGNGIRINETGTYAIYSGKGSRNNANNSWLRFIVVYPDSSGHVIAEDYYSAGDSSLVTIGCECITLEAGTIIYLQMYGTASNFLTEQQPLEICKLIQQTPYIIANKGALVSGGAFRFDVDGNAFTENYSSGEMRVGTWVDNKPIYQSCILATTSVSGSTVWMNTNTPVPANLKLLVSAKIVSPTNDKYYVEALHFDVSGSTIQVWCSGNLIIAANRTYFILKYTKTTD